MGEFKKVVLASIKLAGLMVLLTFLLIGTAIEFIWMRIRERLKDE